ncbi:MAG: GspH/FimT family pseudopilin [Patescibacteria group bacterium]
MLFSFFLHKINPRGFQLIQLIMVCAIIGIMAVMSVPLFTKYRPDAQLTSAAKQLASDLRYAQQKTVSEQQIYYIEITPLNKEYSIIKTADPGEIIKTVSIGQDITFQEISGFTDNKIIFNSYGAVSESGDIILSNLQENAITVQVKPSGYIKLQE